MGSTWEHPELGRFKFDVWAWSKTIDVPKFKAFSYDTGYRNARRSKGRHVLAFEADDTEDVPSEAAIKLAAKVLANQAALIEKVVKALWDDINGRGPNSGMWWHGDPEGIVEYLDPKPQLQKPGDLLGLLQIATIVIRKGVNWYEKPLVELSFHAAFEEEHGVGVLTDCKTILGTGYSSDVTPYKRRRGR